MHLPEHKADDPCQCVFCKHRREIADKDAEIARLNAQLSTVAATQRDACAKEAVAKSGPEYEIPRRVAEEVSHYVALTPLVSGFDPRPLGEAANELLGLARDTTGWCECDEGSMCRDRTRVASTLAEALKAVPTG